MSEVIRTHYLETVDPRFASMVARLDEAVRAAAPALAPRISYGLLMYGLNGDYRNWVCAIGTTKKVVTLRFLWGNLLEDKAGLLRPGSTTIGNLDYAAMEQIDVTMVEMYVREAAEKYADFKASAAKK
jgi:hypothetical protein